MLQYMSCRDAAERWNISQRRVSVLCSENRIPNVAMLGNMWIIPINAEKDMVISNPKLKLEASEMAEIAAAIASKM